MIPLLFLILAVTVGKTATVVSDPYNGTLTPKAIPGALVDYTITVTNGTLGPLDLDKTIVTDAIPTKTKFCLADLNGANSGPVVASTLLTGVTYTFTALNSGTDDLEFSKDNGSTYAYTPSADSDNCDAAITNVRIKTKGKLSAGAAPSFRFRVMVK